MGNFKRDLISNLAVIAGGILVTFLECSVLFVHPEMLWRVVLLSVVAMIWGAWMGYEIARKLSG